jgi:very-short-patch-repair endonuclease
VLDFVSLERRLVVEVDGSQHQESEHDRLRDQRLRSAGFRILRFWNNQVLEEMDAVIEVIWHALATDSTPSPSQPSP